MTSTQVADINWLTPTVAVGGDLHPDRTHAAAQVRWLAAQGVTDIIDCRGEYSDEDVVAAFAPGVSYHHIPADDHGGQMQPSWWSAGVGHARAALANGGTVFAHCHMGINRGPSMAFAILVDQGWEPVEAFRLIRSRRPQAFAIYSAQFLNLMGRADEAAVLQAVMDTECNHDALVATIGQVRTAVHNTGYRYPMAS